MESTVKNDRTILSNKADNIMWDTGEGTCALIDTAFSGDINMIKEEADKILKYKGLNNTNTMYVKHTKLT